MTPRVYIACLASYNNGTLHGAWIDADQEPEDIQDAINQILRDSKYPNVMVECPGCEGEKPDLKVYCAGSNMPGYMPDEPPHPCASMGQAIESLTEDIERHYDYLVESGQDRDPHTGRIITNKGEALRSLRTDGMCWFMERHYFISEDTMPWEDLEACGCDPEEYEPCDPCPLCHGKGQVPSAEEWAIHDYEDMVGMGEYASVEEISKHGLAIAEHGEAWRAFCDLVGTGYATLEDFEEAYCGQYSSEQEYAEQLIGDCYNLQDMMGDLCHYFDYEKLARDLFISDCYFDDETGHVFRRV